MSTERTGFADKDLPPPPPDPGAVTALDVASAQGFGAPLPDAPRAAVVGEQKQAPTKEEVAARTEITDANNPSESHEQRMLRERGPRISINAPNRRLEVPPIEGYHLHWFLERNIPRALRNWYEFVDPREVPTVDRSIGGRTEGTTSEDLGGGRVAQMGGVNEMGQPEQLILMKIKQEYYFQDQRKIAERNLALIQQIFHKKAPLMAPGESKADADQRYTREAVVDMSNGRFRQR